MIAILKYFICLACLLIASAVSSSEPINYQNISINANSVTLNEVSNQLTLNGEIKIDFGNFSISGKSALLDYKEESLLILGTPASIISRDQKINGKADRLIIYPNLSMEMIGNAELLAENRSIFSQHITYQINADDQR
jgi:lipopolysaccharide export system protein LptA|tara:strand:- start:357 stop:770 length:414 start_codon:yes stop_codon:yes gene_type:complete